jgi:hypothetical protein
MAKKSRRARRQASQGAQPVRVSRPVRPQAEAPSKEVNFSVEYAYVVEDLRRIVLIAGALLVLLIVLVFIIG